MFAIIESGGKQYRVSEGDTVEVEKLPLAEGEEVIFENVLMLKDADTLKVGNPFLEGCRVTGRVERQGRARKIIVFKYKPKKNYRRKRGHRQPFTRVIVEKIDFDG
ncbi:MAG: 50S ribosomal protein L21 [Firmicutes bacterium]|nr:50S ribosomal protein L21 [Bacillota bacterium]